jgi:hypothetical protein
MTAATAEALAKTLNALVREGWGDPTPEEKAEPHVQQESPQANPIVESLERLRSDLVSAVAVLGAQVRLIPKLKGERIGKLIEVKGESVGKLHFEIMTDEDIKVFSSKYDLANHILASKLKIGEEEVLRLIRGY